jgi:serine/threonine-protein kinase PknK
MALAEKTGEAGGDRLDIASEDHALSRRTESGTRHAGVLSMPIGPVTKYRPPRNIRRMVERSRLTDLLHLGGERRLIAIHGPAGFGKSTLAVQWSSHLKEMGASVAWLAIDRDDNNLVWFLAHVLEAIRKVRPLRIEELVCALEEHGDDAERFVLTSLIDDIHESGERLALVIDDWHRVTDAPTIASLEYLIDNSCHHLQLIVTSRNRSGLPLSRTRVHDELVEIDSSQLKFDIDEAQDFFNELGELALSRTEVTQIVRSTDGWAAALQLASLSLRGRSDAAAFIGAMSGRHHAIGDYLAENVLDSLDPPIVDFLLSICVTERICGELALVLTQGRYGQAMLEEVERRDLFLYQADDEGEWYRFSGVFSEFLRGRLERDHPERKNDLHRIAFQWFADRRLLREAVDHALAAGDAEQAITLVEECGMYLVDHGQMVTLLGLIDKLPPREILDRPRLQIAIAQANVSLHRSAAAVSALDLADSSLKKTADDQVNHALVVEANVVRGVLDVTMDRIGNVELLVSPCLQEPDSQSAWTVSVAANIKSFVHICRFEFDAARQLQDWAAHYHRHAEGTFTEVYGYCYAGLAAFEQLDIPAAEMSFLHALQTARESMGFHSHAARMASALLGELRYEQNRIKEAERLLDESHAMGSEIALVDFMIAIYVIGSRVKVLAGDISAAAELLNEGKTIARSMDLPRLAAHIKSEEMRQGPSPVANAGRTAKVYQGGGIEAIAAQVMEASAIRQMLRIQESPTIDAACGRARQLVQEIARDNRPRALLQAKILLAVCLIETGRQAEAEEILIPVVQRCAELGLVRLVADAGPQLMRSLAQIREVAPSFIHEVETAGSEGINPTQ